MDIREMTRSILNKDVQAVKEFKTFTFTYPDLSYLIVATKNPKNEKTFALHKRLVGIKNNVDTKKPIVMDAMIKFAIHNHFFG